MLRFRVGTLVVRVSILEIAALLVIVMGFLHKQPFLVILGLFFLPERYYAGWLRSLKRGSRQDSPKDRV